jgi:hypothetical protein
MVDEILTWELYKCEICGRRLGYLFSMYGEPYGMKNVHIVQSRI